MLLMIALMAIGVIFGRKAIKGSCGGANCDCHQKCDKRKKQAAAQSDVSIVNMNLISPQPSVVLPKK
jgi:hypothetical protein